MGKLDMTRVTSQESSSSSTAVLRRFDAQTSDTEQNHATCTHRSDQRKAGRGFAREVLRIIAGDHIAFINPEDFLMHPFGRFVNGGLS